MLDHVRWKYYRRYLLANSIHGFKAHRKSFVDRNSYFEGYNFVHEQAIISNSTIGLFTYVNGKVSNCQIGRFCSIGTSCIIGLRIHPTHWASTHPVFYSTKKQSGYTFSEDDYFEENKLITIGNDVWIGTNAIVLDGVKIGDGAIVASGATVVKDVEPYAIVGGVPAKIIRSRYDSETIAKLLKLQWWNWPLAELKKATPLFRSSDDDAVYRLVEYAKHF